ncbi:alpha/beta fold hydrolase [Mobilicoccus massiliensis]|uniref:alpha/beta fold hydrolase n=1 Tax=Mobilicoccus massiliensis TaxID=1522310 RepID=UPI0006934526|nr:alpha/beta hydrolase [Mobilicoccus massiliensis]
MYVLDTGDGEPIVFIPGLGADHTMYAPQIEALTEFRRLAVDLRGTGASPSLDGVPTEHVLTTQVEDLATMLKERGIERPHLVGISYGGVVVEAFLLRHPGVAASAIICDSLCDTRPRTVLERIQMAGAKAQPFLLKALPMSWNRASVRLVYRKRWPLAAEVMARSFSADRLDDIVKQRRVVNAVHFETALANVRTPVLCLVGDHSSLAVGMMRRVHDALTGSEFTVIEGSFDPSSLCRPGAFTQHVREWVGRHSSHLPRGRGDGDA